MPKLGERSYRKSEEDSVSADEKIKEGTIILARTEIDSDHVIINSNS